MIQSLAAVLIFPGFVFLAALAMIYEFADRKLYARLQNRQGPPWFQPMADFIKLAAKEDIVPEGAQPLLFRVAPLIALTATVTAGLYVPLWDHQAVFSFAGDLIVVVYLLTIPTVCFFLAGWSSNSLFSTLGAVRALTQLFAYEVPLLLAILAPALFAGSWSLSQMALFYSDRPAYLLIHLLGLVVALVALQGKLEKVPFDIPEAETEIVGGSFTEYTGRLLALFRLAIDIELVVGCSLLASVFLPFGLELGLPLGLLLYLLKILVLVFCSALIRTVVARLRIEQMVDFCWRWVAPAALVQIILSLVLRGVLLS